jgi:hypothetical protein
MTTVPDTMGQPVRATEWFGAAPTTHLAPIRMSRCAGHSRQSART